MSTGWSLRLTNSSRTTKRFEPGVVVIRVSIRIAGPNKRDSWTCPSTTIS